MEAKGSYKMYIGHNNTSLSHEVCPICGGEAGNIMGGSNIPLEVFLASEDGKLTTDPVCEDCKKEHAPMLAQALEAFYEDL